MKVNHIKQSISTKMSLITLVAGLSLFLSCGDSKKDNKGQIGTLFGLNLLSKNSSTPSSGTNTPTSTPVAATTGASIQSPTVTLNVPAGALDEDTTISYKSISLPEPKDGFVPYQAAYDFEPHGIQFNKPASLKICYDSSLLEKQGLQEKTLQISYYDPNKKEYVSMGGEVDFTKHCVESSIYHFSNYILTAQLLTSGNNAPTIGGASFFPATPIVGLPATIRTAINDFDAGSSIANASFYYRIAGSGSAFTAIALTQEEQDTTGQFYSAVVPETAFTSIAGIEYYIEAFDTLNASRKLPTTAPTTFTTRVADNPDAVTPIRFNATITNMTAGFARDLTVQVKGQSAATFFPVVANTHSFDANKGTSSRVGFTSFRYRALTIGASALNASYGSLNLTRAINIFPGQMSRIELFLNNVQMPNSFNLDSGTLSKFDVLGFDNFGNSMFVLPNFTASPAIGTFSSVPAEKGWFTALVNNTANVLNGQISISVGSYVRNYDVNINRQMYNVYFGVYNPYPYAINLLVFGYSVNGNWTSYHLPNLPSFFNPNSNTIIAGATLPAGTLISITGHSGGDSYYDCQIPAGVVGPGSTNFYAPCVFTTP